MRRRLQWAVIRALYGAALALWRLGDRVLDVRHREIDANIAAYKARTASSVR